MKPLFIFERLEVLATQHKYTCSCEFSLLISRLLAVKGLSLNKVGYQEHLQYTIYYVLESSGEADSSTPYMYVGPENSQANQNAVVRVVHLA